jgi:hypothetical protein
MGGAGDDILEASADDAAPVDPAVNEDHREKVRTLLGDLMDSPVDDDILTAEPPDERARLIGELVASLLPGVGEPLSVIEAYSSFLAARRALKDKDLAAAIEHGGEAAINALGAIPVLGATVRWGKGTVKAVQSLKRAHGRADKATDAATAARRLPEGVADRWEKRFEPADFEAFVKRFAERTPLGFKSRGEVVKVVTAMQDKLRAVAFDQVKIVIRGSAATGHRFESGRYVGPAFDAEKKSDHDWALVDADLFEVLKKDERVRFSSDGTRTKVVPNKVWEDLGLENLVPNVSDRGAGFVVFPDMKTLERAGPYIPLDP